MSANGINEMETASVSDKGENEGGRAQIRAQPLPCPFCGNAELSEGLDDQFREWIECDECAPFREVIAFGADYTQAVEMWNRRPQTFARDASIGHDLVRLCGYVGNGTSTSVMLEQDDATKWWGVTVGKLHYYGETLRDAIDAAIAAEICDRLQPINPAQSERQEPVNYTEHHSGCGVYDVTSPEPLECNCPVKYANRN